MRTFKRLAPALSVFAAAAAVGAVATFSPQAEASPAPTPAPVPTTAYVQPVNSVQGMDPLEDEPGWDCRVHGNHECGVFYEGIWQVITFDESGEPVSLRPRGF